MYYFINRIRKLIIKNKQFSILLIDVYVHVFIFKYRNCLLRVHLCRILSCMLGIQSTVSGSFLIFGVENFFTSFLVSSSIKKL